MTTQLERVKKVLLNEGYVSRNTFLQERITRLGALINILINQGWVIEGRYVKINGGKDYQYFLIDCPLKKVEYRINGNLVGTLWEKK